MSGERKFYIFVIIALIVGSGWLAYEMQYAHAIDESHSSVCFIKNTTGIPCPSCGSTRSILSLWNGNISEALYYNPLGIIIAILMVITPLWLLYDLLLRKQSLYSFFRQTEQILNKKIIAIPLIFLLIAIWIFNIAKGL